MHQINDYYYKLPKSLISQVPPGIRGNSRLLRLNRKSRSFSHHLFRDIGQFFRPSDILVINDTKVIPAKLLGKKKMGGKIELLLLDFAKHNERLTTEHPKVLSCLVKASRSPKSGTVLVFQDNLEAVILGSNRGIYSVIFNDMSSLKKAIYKFGQLPLPPYIKRSTSSCGKSCATDILRYQTVYASKEGAIAAPTAGLHITEKIIQKLKNMGITIVTITLHVGYGTFVPVRVDDIRKHEIHSEWFSISKKAANIINKAKEDGDRVVAVGTTSVRALEFSGKKNEILGESNGECDLFIYPGYKFKIVDAMITNFHLPCSTLLMLVSAFSGMDNVLNAYQAAISKKYNFFSYGDAMMID